MRALKKTLSIIICIAILTSTLCTFQITSFASGTADSYTVLVLDTSISMKGTPLQNLQDAAKTFCVSLLGASSINEIAIVGYNETCTYLDFTRSYPILKSKIESLTVDNGTNMYDALATANYLLNNVNSSAEKNIVLLTDEVPTSGPTSEYGPYTLENGFVYYQYANAVYNLVKNNMQGYNIYTLGFFHSTILEPNRNLTKNLFSDINTKGCYYPQNSFDLAFAFSDVANSIKKMIPTTYNFYRDSYSFINYSDDIDNAYFQTLFEKGQGFDLWKIYHNQGGVCFGMTYTTASLINGYPDCDNIRQLFNTSNGIFGASSTIKIGNRHISIRDYIKYAQIYQFSSEFAHNSTWSDIHTIYNLVESYLKNNQIGVTIGMTRYDGSGGHRVLAVGIDGNDILIDDPNNIDDFERISIKNDGSWSFSGLNNWNSETCKIRYSLDYHIPYSLLLTGKTVHSADNENDTINYIDGIDVLDKDNLLLTISDDSLIDDENFIKINPDDAGISNKTEKTQYWVLDNDSITVSNLEGKNNEIRLAGNDTIIEAKITNAADLTITINDVESNITINSIAGNNYELSLFDFEEDKFEPSTIKLVGTASSDTVSASKTEDGVVVAGLNDITITYSEDEKEISQTTAQVEDGREINITVDDQTNEVKTDFFNENSPAEPEQKSPCDYCGKIHGDSFWETIMEFIHMLLNFITKIFN